MQSNVSNSMNMGNLKSVIVEMNDSINNDRDSYNEMLKADTKDNKLGGLGPTNTFHHHPSTISQLSNYKRELNNYSSVSPSRSAIGLAP